MQDTNDASLPRRGVLVLGALAACSALAAAAQTRPAQGAPAGRPPYAFYPAPPQGEEKGFRSIFDGRSLTGWEGDMSFWRVEGGAIVGQTTAGRPLESNSFLVWRGGEPADFELKVDVRLSDPGNSGVNYRSIMVPDDRAPANRFAMKGYQLDIDTLNQFTGNVYEEKGRRFLALRGQFTRVAEGERTPILLSSHPDPDALAKAAAGAWTRLHIIARGPVLIHLVNGEVVAAAIDDDRPNASRRGLLGLQLHVGPPLKVEYRNLRILERWER